MSDPNQNPFRPNYSQTQPSASIPTNLLSHPPSRLSPVHGVDLLDLLGQASSSAGPSHHMNDAMTGGSTLPPQTQPGTGGVGNTVVGGSLISGDNKKKKDEKDGYVPKRGYRACVHCRLRKARCDLGDVNAPSEPPCSRCRREQRDCVFLPSKRRRKTSSAAEGGQRETSLDPSQAEVYPARGSSVTATSNPAPGNPATQQLNQSPYENKPTSKEWSIPTFPQIVPSTQTDDRIQQNHNQLTSWNENPPQPGPSNQMFPPPQPSQTPQHHPDTTTPGSLGESSIASTSGQSPGHRAKKRRTEPDGTRKIVNASLSNEMDALEILANAATEGDADGDSSGGKGKNTSHGDAKRVSWDIGEDSPPTRELQEFHLIKNRILDEYDLQDLVTTFFRDHHPSLPIFQTARIPRTREQLQDLASNDSFLLTCIVAVASRHPVDHKYREIHDRTWSILRETLADYSFAGLPGSVGFVEGVLLLAEHLPREKATPPRPTSLHMLAGPGSEAAGEHGTDNRRSWSMTGLAIRAAYLLGLDQIALEINEDERTPDMSLPD
ncbi:uncharacterized protein IL334_007124 [Kwoniella shivajii]|uniref:Zn(2)-C6 fungal-type domain-containing protein n=1 Tax=Kwoniella shivajii TaxID=564305 RepID=A0ABZ1D9X7_9TREE|nr:hypothetical protein IL334_007124 [Kwoniella shivajii]